MPGYNVFGDGLFFGEAMLKEKMVEVSPRSAPLCPALPPLPRLPPLPPLPLLPILPLLSLLPLLPLLSLLPLFSSPWRRLAEEEVWRRLG
jgi:hypothetical protein